VTETVSAATKYDAAAALALLAGMTKLVAAKGKSVVEFDLKKGRPDDDALLAHLLGPTGNLRAPAMRVGKTFVVGFSPEVYAKVLG
jgi:arsenate reductase-like glutaredoxin family protein